jgi:hypothetical protein
VRPSAAIYENRADQFSFGRGPPADTGLDGIYAGNCLVDLVRLHPERYTGLLIELAKLIVAAAEAGLPALEPARAAALPPSFGDSAPPADTGR